MSSTSTHSYVMKGPGSTRGKVTRRRRIWSAGKQFRVPEDVPDGEFDHLAPGAYTTRYEAQQAEPQDDDPKDDDPKDEVKPTEPGTYETRPVKPAAPPKTSTRKGTK